MSNMLYSHLTARLGSSTSSRGEQREQQGSSRRPTWLMTSASVSKAPSLKVGWCRARARWCRKDPGSTPRLGGPAEGTPLGSCAPSASRTLRSRFAQVLTSVALAATAWTTQRSTASHSREWPSTAFGTVHRRPGGARYILCLESIHWPAPLLHAPCGAAAAAAA